jgi:uncharacterized DUF497 family protein
MGRAWLYSRLHREGGVLECEPDFIRVISLRKATRRESKEFEKAINDRLEAN